MAAFGVILAFVVGALLAIPSLEDIGNTIISSIYHALRPLVTGQAAQAMDMTFAAWLLIYALIALAGIVAVFAAIMTIMKWISRF